MTPKIVKGIAPTRTAWIAPRLPAAKPVPVKPAVAP